MATKLARIIWTKSWRIPCETRLQKGERRDISIKYGDIALEPSLTLKIDICEDCTRDKSQKKLLVFLCHCIDALDMRQNGDRQVAPSCWDFEKQPRSMYPLPRPLSHSSEGTPKVVTGPSFRGSSSPPSLKTDSHHQGTLEAEVLCFIHVVCRK